MIENTIETLAAAHRANLVLGKRELVGNGPILVRADDAPDSLRELCYAVHTDASDSFPSDWLYLFIGEALDSIAEFGEDFYQNNAGEDRYHVLATWLAECPDSAWHCDQVKMGDDAGIYSRLEAGYRAQWENVGQVVLGELNDQLEEMEAAE